MSGSPGQKKDIHGGSIIRRIGSDLCERFTSQAGVWIAGAKIFVAFVPVSAGGSFLVTMVFNARMSPLPLALWRWSEAALPSPFRYPLENRASSLRYKRRMACGELSPVDTSSALLI